MMKVEINATHEVVILSDKDKDGDELRDTAVSLKVGYQETTIDIKELMAAVIAFDAKRERKEENL